MELVSPELVLVAPPELARLAREQLPLPWEVWTPAMVAIETRGPTRLVTVAFCVVCLLNSLAPVALSIALLR